MCDGVLLQLETRAHFAAMGMGIATALELRHRHDCQLVRDDLQGEIAASSEHNKVAVKI